MWFMGMQILLSTFWSWRTWCRWLWNRKERDGQQWHRSVFFFLLYFQGIFLPEGAPLHILATETDMDSIMEQRAKGHIFPKSPVTHTLTHHVCAALQDTSQTWNITAIWSWTVDPFWNEAGGRRTAPPCMVKSFIGTEAAMFPIWWSCPSLMPVELQLIVFGCPSSVKNSAGTHTNMFHVNNNTLSWIHILHYMGKKTNPATASPASVWCEGSSHLWSGCTHLRRFCHILLLPPEGEEMVAFVRMTILGTPL